MKQLDVRCPDCGDLCGVTLEMGELTEGDTSEGFEGKCDCGCFFSFDVYVEILNKKIIDGMTIPASSTTEG